MRPVLLIISLLFSLTASALTLTGRVVDETQQPILYATVYIKENPLIGTATDTKGLFSLEVPDGSSATLMVSCVGYALYAQPLNQVQDEPLLIALHSQPIALEETVVSARKNKKSKRKLLATVLHDTYTRLQAEWPTQPVQYKVVSDLKMDADSAAWGAEQLIATAIEIPTFNPLSHDSLQFRGDYCKRYCDPAVRIKVDMLMLHEQDKRMRRMASALDSGTLVHRALWSMSLHREHLLDMEDELSRWRLGTEDDSTIVLTYTRKYSRYLGVMQATWVEHLLVDSYDFSVRAYTVDLQAKLYLPFSIRLKGSQLEWVNLLNMSNESLDKFRLKQGMMHSRISTLYTREDGHIVPKEKNMHTTALLQDIKGNQLPCEVWATQHVVSVRTQDVKPFARYYKSHKVPREIVPIY